MILTVPLTPLYKVRFGSLADIHQGIQNQRPKRPLSAKSGMSIIIKN